MKVSMQGDNLVMEANTPEERQKLAAWCEHANRHGVDLGSEAVHYARHSLVINSHEVAAPKREADSFC